MVGVNFSVSATANSMDDFFLSPHDLNELNFSGDESGEYPELLNVENTVVAH